MITGELKLWASGEFERFSAFCGRRAGTRYLCGVNVRLRVDLGNQIFGCDQRDTRVEKDRNDSALPPPSPVTSDPFSYRLGLGLSIRASLAPHTDHAITALSALQLGIEKQFLRLHLIALAAVPHGSFF